LFAVLITAFVFSLLQLNYREDISDFLPESNSNREITEAYQQISNSNRLIIYFAATDTINNKEQIMEAIDEFVLKLQQADTSHLINEIISQVDESNFYDIVTFIQDNIPYFLTDKDYIRLDSILKSIDVEAKLKNDKKILMLPSGDMVQQTLLSDPLQLFSPVLQQLRNFRTNDNTETEEGYMFSKNGQKGMVILNTPFGMSETDKNTQILSLINAAIDSTKANDVKITCFGAPAIAVGNAERIKTDSLIAISVAAILILCLLIYFFRSAGNLLLIFVSVAFGWLFALGIMALFNDSISIIAIGISSIFIGIAINYPLHFIDHLQHQSNRKQALKEIIPPLLIGNITTVGAFVSLVFVNADAMKDMGMFGSLLLVGTILFVLIFLPHCVKTEKIRNHSRKSAFSLVSNYEPERKKYIVIPLILLTFVLFYFSQFTSFESDMNKINYMTKQQQEDMKEVVSNVNKEGYETIYLISEGKHLDDAIKTYENTKPLLDSLTQKGLIESISGTGNFLVSQDEQQKRINRWNDFRRQYGESLKQNIKSAAQKTGFKPDAFDSFNQLLDKDFTVQDSTFFMPAFALLAQSYIITEDSNIKLITLLQCPKDQTEALSQSLAAAMQNNSNIFFFDSRNIAARMVDALSNDFNIVLYICGIVVFLFLALSFGRLEISLMAFLPLTLGWVWILGIMHITDMSFNIVNVILASFIFGQGDDYTIFITDGLIYEYTYKKKMLAAHKKSILLSALIMFAGIGVLIFAQHPAMKSLAQVTIIGMCSVVLMAYIVPPLIYKWLTTKDGQPRQTPITLWKLFKTVFAFCGFVIGSFIMTVTGFAILTIGGKNQRNRFTYHRILYRVLKFLARIMPQVPFKVLNPFNENFEKPSVIVCNHQSHLDLLYVLSLSPKIIVLTNRWVWKNPFYGQIIRYAQFLPVADGIEQHYGRIKNLIDNGYSILIFPEGTRSDDCSIKRFHKGAFHLAERFGLEILPLILHGSGNVLNKREFLLTKGSVTISISQRTNCFDHKALRQFYKEAYETLSHECETLQYLMPKVFNRYIYKGYAIEKRVCTSFRFIKNHQILFENLPDKGEMCIMNSGTGEIPFLIAMKQKHLHITAVEPNEDLIDIARNCSFIPSNLTYVTAIDRKDYDITIDLKDLIA
jgi:1-acyl-sn-glycerol-3-phosphate acyltransferase